VNFAGRYAGNTLASCCGSNVVEKLKDFEDPTNNKGLEFFVSAVRHKIPKSKEYTVAIHKIGDHFLHIKQRRID
jgi:hypothetical protein